MYTASAYSIAAVFRCAFGAAFPVFTTAMFEKVRPKIIPVDECSSISIVGRKLGMHTVGRGGPRPLPHPDRVLQIWGANTSW